MVSAFTAEGASLAGREVFSTPPHHQRQRRPPCLQPLAPGPAGPFTGSYCIDNANAQGRFGGLVLFDASVRYRFSERMSVDLQVGNLTDRAQQYAWYDNADWPAGSRQPMFSAGPGRSAYLSLDVKL